MTRIYLEANKQDQMLKNAKRTSQREDLSERSDTSLWCVNSIFTFCIQPKVEKIRRERVTAHSVQQSRLMDGQAILRWQVKSEGHLNVA